MESSEGIKGSNEIDMEAMRAWLLDYMGKEERKETEGAGHFLGRGFERRHIEKLLPVDLRILKKILDESITQSEFIEYKDSFRSDEHQDDPDIRLARKIFREFVRNRFTVIRVRRQL